MTFHAASFTKGWRMMKMASLSQDVRWGRGVRGLTLVVGVVSAVTASLAQELLVGQIDFDDIEMTFK